MAGLLTVLGRRGRSGCAVTWLLLGIAAGTGADWPQYRGPNHDGISTDRIAKQWPENGPPEVWRTVCTNGLSSVAVSGGRVFTQIRRSDGISDQEFCVALDAATGAELWAAPIGPAQYDGGVGYDDGPRSTPSVSDGRVFVLSSYLVLHCLSATNGAPIWSKDLLLLYGGYVISWQNAASPLLDNDLIFVNCNTPADSLFALRATNGAVAWRSQAEAMTHSTPVVASLEGLPQVVFATQSGLVSLNRADGTLLWKASYPFYYNTSLAVSPVVHSNIVFVSAAYSMGSFATRISKAGGVFTAAPLWTNRLLQAHWMTPVAYQGFLYGQFGTGSFDSTWAPLKCVDLLTGVEKWSVNYFGRGGTIMADSHVLSLTETGELVLVKPDPNAYTEVARHLVFPNYDFDTNKCWNVPAVSDGRIYARSTAEAVCLDVAVPPLRLLPPRLLAGGKVQLWIATATGSAIDTNRLTTMEVRSAQDLATPLASWTRLTNSLALTNGMVRVDDVAASAPSYYVAVETP